MSRDTICKHIIKLKNSKIIQIHQNIDAAKSTPTTIIAICTNSDRTVIAAFCDSNFISLRNIEFFPTLRSECLFANIQVYFILFRRNNQRFCDINLHNFSCFIAHLEKIGETFCARKHTECKMPRRPQKRLTIPIK